MDSRIGCKCLRLDCIDDTEEEAEEEAEEEEEGCACCWISVEASSREVVKLRAGCNRPRIRAEEVEVDATNEHALQYIL